MSEVASLVFISLFGSFIVDRLMLFIFSREVFNAQLEQSCHCFERPRTEC